MSLIRTIRVVTGVGTQGPTGPTGPAGPSFTLNASTGSVSLVAGTNITLQSNASTITIVGGGGAGAAFTLNASTGSVSLIAGNNITLQSNASTITISGPSVPTATNFSLNATSSSVSISAGVNIGIGQANSTITVSASNQTSSLSYVAAFGTAAATSTGTIVLAAGNNITLNTGASSITIVGPTVPAATNFSLNATSSSVSISAGAGIGTGQANSTITISASVQTSSVSVTALGNTTGSSSGTFSNLLNISGAGAVSVGAGAGSITVSSPVATNFVLNATSSSVSISAGAGIGIGQANSTITISASVQAQGTQSFSGGGTSITGTGISVALVGGNNISLASASGAGSLTLTIHGSSNATNNVSSLNGSSGAMSVSAGAGIGIGQANSTLTISASNQTSSLSYVAAIGTGAATSTGTIVFAAGANITLNTGVSSITIVGPAAGAPPTLSFTQNDDLGLVAGTIVSKAGTITGTAGVGSSLFLQRLRLGGPMSVSEVDVALSIGFPATNQGAGTMSRSLVIYSFGNSTSLASVASKSSTYAWATGTSTAGGNASLTQFQGGWSSPLIQPMTFATTSIAAGDYVVGNLFNFAQDSSTWTLNFYGVQAASTFLASAATNLTSATLGALSSGGLAAGSGINGISSIATAFWPMLQSASFGSTSMSAITWGGSSSANTSAIRAVSVTLQAGSSSAQLGILAAIGNSVSMPIFSVGTVAGSIIGTSGSLGAVTNVAISTLNSSTLAQLALPNFGFIGTGSTTSGFPTAFLAGIMSTGAVPVAITLTSAAVTYSGSVAFQQPWFALAGA